MKKKLNKVKEKIRRKKTLKATEHSLLKYIE